MGLTPIFQHPTQIFLVCGTFMTQTRCKRYNFETTKMNKALYIFLATLLLYINEAKAQQVWKLEDCVKKAVQENFRMKQAKLNTQSNVLDVHQARAQMLPSLNGSGTQAFNLGRNVDPFTNTFSNQTIRSNNFTLQANWVLFNGFQVQNTIKREQYDLQSWQVAYGKDINSKKTPSPIPNYTINSVVEENKFTNGSFNSDVNGVYCYTAIGNCSADLGPGEH